MHRREVGQNNDNVRPAIRRGNFKNLIRHRRDAGRVTGMRDEYQRILNLGTSEASDDEVERALQRFARRLSPFHGRALGSRLLGRIWYQIATVAEPALRIRSRDSSTCILKRFLESLTRSCSNPTQDGFHFGKSLFNGRKV